MASVYANSFVIRCNKMSLNTLGAHNLNTTTLNGNGSNLLTILFRF